MWAVLNTWYTLTHTHTNYTHAHTHTHFVVDCGVPLTLSNDSITTVYNSTLEGSLLELSCRDVVTAVCFPDGMWIPDPNMHTCKSITSDSSGSTNTCHWATLQKCQAKSNVCNCMFWVLYLSTVGNLSPMLNRDVITTAVVSSIIIILLFIFSSTLFFIIGCFCG